MCSRLACQQLIGLVEHQQAHGVDAQQAALYEGEHPPRGAHRHVAGPAAGRDGGGGHAA
jgi:hypothetical protein